MCFRGMHITGISKLFEPSRSFTLKGDQMLVVLLSVPENHEHGVISLPYFSVLLIFRFTWFQIFTIFYCLCPSKESVQVTGSV